MEYELIEKRTVADVDGFDTDLCLYAVYEDGDLRTFIIMLGDTDIYEPDVDYAEWESDDYRVAYQWFLNWSAED